MNKKTRVNRNQAREKILDFLLWKTVGQFYEKEISEGSGVSKSAVNVVMEELVENEWVSFVKKGRLNLYQVNITSAKVKGYKRSIAIRKLEKLRKYLVDKVEKLILFGSAARGEDIEMSDLDLLIVSLTSIRLGDIKKYFPEGRKVQLLIKTPDEFRDLRRKNTVLYEAIVKGERLI